MKDSPMISVVMPVYNAEAYLDKAVESILNQTYSNLELILVDDCSTDGSRQICEEWVSSDSRIKLLKLAENMGPGNARNEGLRAAIGDYLAFMDSDDTLDKDAYQTAVYSLNTHPADVVVFGLTEEYYNRQGEMIFTQHVFLPEGYYSTQEEVRKEVINLELSTLYGYPVNKLYSINTIRRHDLKFPDIKLGEDALFNIEYFMHISSMNIMGLTPYHYAKRTALTLTGRFVPEYYQWHRLRIEKLLDQHERWGLATVEVKRILGNIYTRYIFSALQRHCDKRSGMAHSDRKNWLINLYIDALYQELAPFSRPDSRVLSILNGLLKSRKSGLVLAMARMICLVKNYLPAVFIRLKQNR